MFRREFSKSEVSLGDTGIAPREWEELPMEQEFNCSVVENRRIKSRFTVVDRCDNPALALL